MCLSLSKNTGKLIQGRTGWEKALIKATPCRKALYYRALQQPAQLLGNSFAETVIKVDWLLIMSEIVLLHPLMYYHEHRPSTHVSQSNQLVHTHCLLSPREFCSTVSKGNAGTHNASHFEIISLWHVKSLSVQVCLVLNKFGGTRRYVQLIVNVTAILMMLIVH